MHEVITARHCGVKVLAFSLITNLCETDDDDDDEFETRSVETGKCENGNVENENVKNGNVENGNAKNERVDVILEELKDCISKRGPILKKFVSTLVQYLDKET